MYLVLPLVRRSHRREKERPHMTTLNIITALFIMAATYGAGRNRFLSIIGFAALALAPAAMGIIDGLDGLIFSLAGAGAALFLTFPLAYLRLVARTDVIISAALGGILGAFPFVAAFCIATGFLAIQRAFGIQSLPAPAGDLRTLSPYGAGLLAFDEQSALVEIEAMKILRRDVPKTSGAPLIGVQSQGSTDAGNAAPGQTLPWCAKLAIATLVVLMFGSSI